jgi:site-specific recombinase XerD
MTEPQIAANAAARRRRTASPETQRLYAADWKSFEAWCTDQGRVALPAEPATVAAFLTAGAESLSAGALGRRAAAIGDRHRQRGLASPVKDPTVKAVLCTARLTATPRRVPPQRPNTLISMAARCPRDLAGLRDRALLLLAAQGLGRAALVGASLAVCPVQALRAWLDSSATRFGPVFRKIDRWGSIEHHRLGTDAVRRILARRALRRARRPRTKAAA